MSIADEMTFGLDPAAQIAALVRERDEARNAIEAACDTAVTAACAAVERECDEAYEQRDAMGAINAELVAALEAAKSFIEDDTCRHDSEKGLILVVARGALARARGGR